MHISLSSQKGFSRHRCEVLAVGHSREQARRYCFENRRRQRFSLLQYTLSGAGRFRAGNAEPVAVPAAHAFLVNCPSATSYWLPDGGSWEFVYWVFLGDMAAWHVEQIVGAQGHVFSLPGHSVAAGLLQQTYREAAERRALDKHLLSARLYQVLMDLYQLERDPPVLGRVTSFVEKEYANPALAVSDMAKQAGLSVFHFSRVFRQEHGASPLAYLTKVRLYHARNLLLSTPFPIKQVAQLVGFSDSSYFCRVFRRHFHHSPNRSRRLKG